MIERTLSFPVPYIVPLTYKGYHLCMHISIYNVSSSNRLSDVFVLNSFQTESNSDEHMTRNIVSIPHMI